MVIATVGWMRNVLDYNQDSNMSATGILICHDNSYPFQERTLSLEQPIKIGRSVAKARAAVDNAIFDCKVLSRNHAVLWYESGKFYLKDTKSSNGTFVNNKRLSPSGEDSIPCEICSGDVVQFGVDVVESTKKVTHGCIVATLKLYLPDGKEAKANPLNSVAYVNVTLEDLYKLNQFIQEAGHRENALRSKLEYMQQLLEHTRIAANQSWKSLVLEDCLLSRLEMLESQVIAYSKNFGEDKLRNELVTLLKDKAQYQNATKELLQKKVQEKREFLSKVQILKYRLSETEEETQSLHNIVKTTQNELQELAIKYIKVQQTLQDTTDKLNKTKNKLQEVVQQSEIDKQEFMKKFEDQKGVEKDLVMSLRDSKLDSVHIHKQISALKNHLQMFYDINSVSSDSLESKNYPNPMDAINIILSDWNSMQIKILNDFQIYEKQENNIHFLDDVKLNEKFSLHNDLWKNNQAINSKQFESVYNYLLPTITGKTLFLSNSILNKRNLKDQITQEFLHSNNENSSTFENDCELNLHERNKNSLITKVHDDLMGEKEKSIASVNLIMKFASNKGNIYDEISKHNIYDVMIDHIDYKSSFKYDVSPVKIMKIAQQIKRVIEMNRDLLHEPISSKVQYLHLQNQYLIDILKLLPSNNLVSTKLSQELALQNLHLSDFLKMDDSDKQRLVKDSHKLKHGLSSEFDENIDVLEKSNGGENEIQVQELSEQLIILKEKYNAIIEEKTNIIKRYSNLENQHKESLYTSFMIPLHYVVPIIFGLIWMLLEKML